MEKISGMLSWVRRLFRKRTPRHVTVTATPSSRLEALRLRPLQVSVDDTMAVGLGDRLEIEKSHGSEVVGIGISDSSGTSLDADVNADGTTRMLPNWSINLPVQQRRSACRWPAGYCYRWMKMNINRKR